jgi:hypothetical protein
LIADVVREWKEEVRSAREHTTLRSDIFWNSRDYEEQADAVSYYRFFEVFDIGEFPKSAEEIEEMFREELMMPADTPRLTTTRTPDERNCTLP